MKKIFSSILAMAMILSSAPVASAKTDSDVLITEDVTVIPEDELAEETEKAENEELPAPKEEAPEKEELPTVSTETPKYATAESDGVIFTYTYSDTNATITGASNVGEILAIPPTIDGYTVTSIGTGAFGGLTIIENVVISDSVTSIGDYAFEKCTNLVNVTLSKSLRTLGQGAFAYTAIEAIEIPKSLDSCGTDSSYTYSYTFDNVQYRTPKGPFAVCEKLKTVMFEEGVTQIAASLFDGCISLESITIPDTVTIIEQNAFRNCLRLKNVEIGNNVKTIGSSAFVSCVSLPKIIIPGCVRVIENKSFQSCTSLTNVTILDGVVGVSIGANSFQGCTALTSVVMANSITSIGNYAFENCASAEVITLSKAINSIGNYVFQNCSSLKSIAIPNNVTTIGEYAFQGCTSLESAKLPKGLKTISKYAFANSGLVEISIPRSVKTIGSQAFMGCASLADIHLADYGITKIEADTFKDCPGLTSVELPKGLTSIGAQAFMNDASLMEVIIPETVTSISSTAFSYPTLTTIYGRRGSYAETFANEYGFTFVNNAIPSEGIILADGSDYVVIDVSEVYSAEFEFYPENTNDVVYLTSSNTNVATITGLDIYGKNAGDAVITATTSSGVTYEFTVHVRKVNKIELVTLPTKLTYNVGEEFDPTGLTVRKIYGDSTVEEITDYTITGFDSDVEGTYTVTVKYLAHNAWTHTVTFEVTIVNVAPKLEEIYISSYPSKLIYNLRESLDMTGFVLMGRYSDGSTAEIEEYTLSGYNALKAGEQTITVTHGEFKTTFTVTLVKESQIVIPENLEIKADSKYTIDETNGAAIVKPSAKTGESLSNFMANIAVDSKFVQVVDSTGAVQTSVTRLITGYKVQLLGADGKVAKEYTIIMLGDTDRNGRYAVSDVSGVQTAVAAKPAKGTVEFIEANIDGNSRLSVADASALQTYLAGGVW